MGWIVKSKREITKQIVVEIKQMLLLYTANGWNVASLIRYCRLVYTEKHYLYFIPFYNLIFFAIFSINWDIQTKQAPID